MMALAFVFIACAVATTGLASTSEARPYQDAEAYRVYSAILPRFLSSFDEREMLFIRRGTVWYSSKCLTPGPSVKKVFQPAMVDYKRVNRSRWQLERRFELERPYELVWEEDYENRSSKAEFPYFIELSAVGFNPSKTIAVVYLTEYCRGSYCLSRNLIVLRKEGERWRDLHDGGLVCMWQI